MAHGWDIQQYLVVFELDGIKHVGGHRGVEPVEIEQERFKSQHPRINILYFKPMKRIEEMQDMVKQLADDPNWAPMSQQEFNASAAAAHQEMPGVPADHPAMTNAPGTTKLPAIQIPNA